MIELQLRGRSGLKVLLDEEDAAAFGALPWRPLRQGGLCYARRDHRDEGRKRTIYLHREVAAVAFGPQAIAGMLVDHVNGDGLDCRRKNLRVATFHENVWAQFKRRHGTSNFKGVCWHVRVGAWLTRIRIGKVQKWLGYFDEEAAAAQMHDAVALLWQGPRARLNFPDLAPAYVALHRGEAPEEVHPETLAQYAERMRSSSVA